MQVCVLLLEKFPDPEVECSKNKRQKKKRVSKGMGQVFLTHVHRQGYVFSSDVDKKQFEQEISATQNKDLR